MEDPLLTLESDKATHGGAGPAGRHGGRGQGQGRRPGLGGRADRPARGRGRGRHPAQGAGQGGRRPVGRASPAGYGSPAGAYETIEVKVPDIGDFKDVPVIEVHVEEGDAVKAEDPLLTLESDKATMECPSPAAGTVAGLKVKVGDRVSQGDADPDAADAGAAKPATAPPRPCRRRPPASAPAGKPASAVARATIHAEVLVLGAGPGGYTAAFRAADLGKQVVLVERWPTLGGVCLNVGCIPSKALLHAAKVIDETQDMGDHGIRFADPTIDIDALRGWKDGVVKKLTGGLSGPRQGSAR